VPSTLSEQGKLGALYRMVPVGALSGFVCAGLGSVCAGLVSLRAERLSTAVDPCRRSHPIRRMSWRSASSRPIPHKVMPFLNSTRNSRSLSGISSPRAVEPTNAKESALSRFAAATIASRCFTSTSSRRLIAQHSEPGSTQPENRDPPARYGCQAGSGFVFDVASTSWCCLGARGTALSRQPSSLSSRSAFWRLWSEHINTTFVQEWSPPRERGTTWSMVVPLARHDATWHFPSSRTFNVLRFNGTRAVNGIRTM